MPFTYNSNDCFLVNALKALGEITRQALDYGDGTIARVFPYWVIAPGIVESLPYLTTNADPTWDTNGVNKPFIHGYCIGEGATGSEPFALNGRNQQNPSISLWGFYQANLGTPALNANHVFLNHRERLRKYINQRQRFQTGVPDSAHPLELMDGLPGMLSHTGLSFDEPEVLKASNTAFYLARATIQLKVVIND